MNLWAITLHKGFVKSVLSGDKTMEVRTRIPSNLKEGDYVLIVQSQTNGKVVCRVKVKEIVKLPPLALFGVYYSEIQLNYLAFHEYTKGKEYVYGIRFELMQQGGFGNATEYGLKRAPQWFARLDIKSMWKK